MLSAAGHRDTDHRRGVATAKVEDAAGALRLALLQGVLKPEPVGRLIAVDGLGRREALGVDRLVLLGLDGLGDCFDERRIGDVDLVDDEADVGAREVLMLVLIAPAGVARSAEQIEVVAGPGPHLVVEGIGHLLAQLLVEG